MLGYEGIVYIDSEPYLATGGSIPPVAKVRLDSNSGYGGKVASPVGEIGIGSPHTYDWRRYEGSLSFEVNSQLYDNVLKPWIFDRTSSKAIDIYSSSKTYSRYGNVYWSAMNLSAAEGGFVMVDLTLKTAAISGYATEDDYKNNKTGIVDIIELEVGGNIPALNPSGAATQPYPYWKSRIKFDGSYKKFTDWTIAITQDVSDAFTCENNSTPQGPSYFVFGPLGITFTGNLMLVNESDTIGNVTDLIMELGASELHMQNAELQTLTNELPGGANAVPLPIEYAIYGLST